MNYPEVVRELEGLGIMPVGLPKLTSIRSALQRTDLGSAIDPKRNIIVAGTNGKGSTAATLSRLLLGAGQRVGLYTSPHLVTTRERIRINDEDISEEDLVSAFCTLRDVIRSEGLTHFEALTLIAAFLFFSGRAGPPVDWAIWEVGMGGLFDATNAIPHHYCAITRLGLDHQAILGSTLEEIAAQKFGVIGERATVVYSPMDPKLADLRTEVASRTRCQWIAARPARSIALDRASTTWGDTRLSLCGARAAENTATALTLFEAMGFDPTHFLHVLEQVRWLGRFSRFGLEQFPCPAYVSGDHNVQGIESFLQILNQLTWSTLHLVVGIGQDKDANLMLEKLYGLPNVKLYLTETPFKPLPLAEYPARYRELAVVSERDVSRMLSRLAKTSESADMILVTGSLYLVGLVL